ncbi:MAG TPA: cytochrome d ubiquinol oxidase subunit II [Solirubrobacteraceae bacterium]|jgi:cytochrome d ubiquinol oxidase subunit II|nr:cytochrome d ubiquinol oxidase subunit II [Solirubrobacteraceae bacterium]
MHLYEIPLIFVLVGLVLYAVLAGADFGAGFWQLLAGPGKRGTPIRDHAHEAMAPVWEANHVWLIFVLTVTWTAYPGAFGSIASTLCVPLFIAALGIVMRGAAYALRAGTSSVREQDRVDLVFALSSVLTPFALGTVIGAIAAQRVPVGNAAGGIFSSWTGATPLLVGALAVANSAYIAAVFLAADAKRTGRSRELQSALRRRALIAGLIAGAVAVAGLIVLHSDAHFLYTRLLEGDALGAVILSALAGLLTLALVAANRFEPARYSAALAVAAVIAGWALAQRPVLLKGLTVQQAAAPHDTLVLVIVAVLGGALILFPSLALLFRLVLRGRLDHGSEDGQPPAADSTARAATGLTQLLAVSSSGLLARIAGACLLTGFATLTVAEAGWAHAIGITALFVFLGTGFLAIVPAQMAELERE